MSSGSWAGYGTRLMVGDRDADGLAAFVRGLPQGDRHAGAFWALNVAIEDGLPDVEIKKVADAALDVGLDEKYVSRTLRQIAAKGP